MVHVPEAQTPRDYCDVAATQGDSEIPARWVPGWLAGWT